MAIGADYDRVMDSCPKELEPFEKAFEISQKIADENAWSLGAYIQSAVAVAIEHNFAGRRAISKYIEKPFSHNSNKLTASDKKRAREQFMAELLAMKANFDLEKKLKER